MDSSVQSSQPHLLISSQMPHVRTVQFAPGRYGMLSFRQTSHKLACEVERFSKHLSKMAFSTLQSSCPCVMVINNGSMMRTAAIRYFMVVAGQGQSKHLVKRRTSTMKEAIPSSINANRTVIICHPIGHFMLAGHRASEKDALPLSLRDVLSQVSTMADEFCG